MLIIDRLEGIFAVCEWEGGSMKPFPKSKFLPDAIEGGCYRKDGDFFLLDEAETARRRKENAALFDKVFGKAK